MPLKLNGSTSGFTQLSAPAVAGNNTLTLPTGSGTGGQVVQTDGAGTLSFVNDAGALFYRLNADLAGANVTTAQNIFGVGVTLAGSTVYQFDSVILMTKTAGATSHTIGTGFGGTATVNNIGYSAQGTANSTNPTYQANYGDAVTTSTANQTITGALSSATMYAVLKLRGTVSINAGGTFIPQYTLSAAPGGAYSTLTGSYIRFVPIGTAGSNSSQGTWS